jgi:signal transduction histidine kinase
MDDTEAHQHRHRSPIAAVVGIAEALLDRSGLDPEVAKHVRAIHALAREALEAEEARSRLDRPSSQSID